MRQPATNFTPRTEALAYRIWAEARKSGWSVSCLELAAALDVPFARVRWVLIAKNWTDRVRASTHDSSMSVEQLKELYNV